ncbi:hypothetical protein PHISP_06029 [Aspergillus sp. HF37]|nr:hypothetical protein PHISP_06029 [Aspergillus sp. HF37]
MTTAQVINRPVSSINRTTRGRTQSIAAFLRTDGFQTNFIQVSLTMDTSHRTRFGTVLFIHSAMFNLYSLQIQCILRLMFNDQLNYKLYLRLPHKSRRISITMFLHTRTSHAWLRSKYLRHLHLHHLGSQVPKRSRRTLAILPLHKWFLRTSKLNLLALLAGP